MKLLRRRHAPPPTPVQARVYSGEGRKAHLMVDGEVLCRWPPPPGGWKGTGSDYEREWAASIAVVCKLCAAEIAKSAAT